MKKIITTQHHRQAQIKKQELQQQHQHHGQQSSSPARVRGQHALGLGQAQGSAITSGATATVQISLHSKKQSRQHNQGVGNITTNDQSSAAGKVVSKEREMKGPAISEEAHASANANDSNSKRLRDKQARARIDDGSKINQNNDLNIQKPIMISSQNPNGIAQGQANPKRQKIIQNVYEQKVKQSRRFQVQESSAERKMKKTKSLTKMTSNHELRSKQLLERSNDNRSFNQRSKIRAIQIPQQTDSKGRNPPLTHRAGPRQRIVNEESISGKILFSSKNNKMHSNDHKKEQQPSQAEQMNQKQPPLNMFDQPKDSNNQQFAPQIHLDRLRLSSASNGGPAATILTSKAGDLTINDGEEEEKQFENIKRIESSRVFQRKKNSDQHQEVVDSRRFKDRKQPLPQSNAAFSSLTPKNHKETPSGGSLTHSDKTPILTDDLNYSNQKLGQGHPGGHRNNFNFEPSIVLESRKAITKNSGKRAFDSTKLNLHPMSPTSQAVSPRNQAPSPLPMTPTSPISASCENEYEELNKNSIEIKSLTLDSNVNQQQRKRMSWRAGKQDAKHAGPMSSAQIPNQLRIDIDQLSDVPLHPIFYYNNSKVNCSTSKHGQVPKMTGTLSQTLRTVEKNKIGSHLASYPSQTHASNNFDNALKALESMKQHSTNQSNKNHPSLGEITPDRSSASIVQAVHPKRTTLAQIKSQATLHQHQAASNDNSIAIGGLKGRVEGTRSRGEVQDAEVDSMLGRKRMLVGISKLIEEQPKIMINKQTSLASSQYQFLKLQDRTKPSDLQQSESPAIRMARKYQDNQKKQSRDESLVPDENSDGDLIAVNDEMRISEEEFEINTDQLKRIIHRQEESEEGEVPETARSLSPRNFMIENSSKQLINRVKQRRTLNHVSNMSNTQNLYQFQQSLFKKFPNRYGENVQNSNRVYDDGGQDLQEIVSNDSDQIVTQKNEPLQAQHYFSNQTRPSIASQDHQRATVLRQVSLNANILNNRYNYEQGLNSLKKSLSNTCSQLNMNVVSPQSNDYSGVGGLAFQGYVGLQPQENTISERKKMLSSSRSIQSLITNQLRDTQLLNNQHVKNTRLGSTQKNSEFGGTYGGGIHQKEQIQLAGPVDLKLVRADLTHLSLHRLNYKLKTIDLSNNKIRHLPKEILSLTNLVTLNLRGNLLETLPNDMPSKADKFKKGFSNSPNIRIATTQSWSNLQKLEELNVSENKLRRLPDNLGGSSNLKSLSIIGNQLCEVPVSLGNLNGLESLHFEWFMYLDPPQQQHQKKDQGHFVIQQFLTFCQTRITVSDYPGPKLHHPTQLSFSSYLCYFHICNKTNRNTLKLEDIAKYLNVKLRFSVKQRCLAQTTICNRHPHLLQHLILATRAKSEYKPSDDMSLHFGDLKRQSNGDDDSEFLSSTRSINNMYLQGQIEVDGREKQKLSTQSVRNINRLIKFLDLEMEDEEESHAYCHVARAVNMVIDLNLLDQSQQTPFLSALRQLDNVYANILIDVVEKAKSMQLVRHYELSKQYEQLQQLEACARWTTKLPDLNISCPKNGYPLHIAVVGHKFDVVLRLLHLGKESIDQIIDLDDGLEPLERMDVDVTVTNSIGANILHLLFVKYEKDFKMTKKILYEIVKMRDTINLNLIDSLQACPLHVAMRKRQFEAINECVKINRSHNSPIFNFNLRNKRTQTPLHYAVEKQDHDLLVVLLRDKFIDPLTIDFEFCVKPRRKTVIFSAFHKLLYQKEKFMIRRAFYKNFYQSYIDFNSLKAYKKNQGMQFDKELFKQPLNYEKQRAKTVRPRKTESVKPENDNFSSYFESMACLNILNRVNHKFDVQSRPLERMFLKNIQFEMTNGPNHRRSLDSKIKPKHLGSRNKKKLADANAAGDAANESYQIQQVFERYQHIDDPHKFYENFNDEANFVSHQLFNFRALRKLQNEKTMRIQQQYMNMGNAHVHRLGEADAHSSNRVTSRSSSQSHYLKNQLSKTTKKSLRSHQNEIQHLEQKQRLERQMKLLQEQKAQLGDSDYVNVGAQPKSTLNYLKYKQAVAASQFVSSKSSNQLQTFSSSGQGGRQKKHHHVSGDKSYDQARQAMNKGGGQQQNSQSNLIVKGAIQQTSGSTKQAQDVEIKGKPENGMKQRRSSSKTVLNVSQKRFRNEKSSIKYQVIDKGSMHKYLNNNKSEASNPGQQQVEQLQNQSAKKRQKEIQKNIIPGQHNIISQNAKQPKPGNLMLNMSNVATGSGVVQKHATQDLQDTQRVTIGSPEKSMNMLRDNSSSSKLVNSLSKDNLNKNVKKRYTLGSKNSISGMQRVSAQVNQHPSQMGLLGSGLTRQQSDLHIFRNHAQNNMVPDNAVSPFSLNPQLNNNRIKQISSQHKFDNAKKIKVQDGNQVLPNSSSAQIISNIVQSSLNNKIGGHPQKDEKFGPKMPRNKFIIGAENNLDHQALISQNNQSSGPQDLETFRTLQLVDEDTERADNQPQAYPAKRPSIKQNLIIHNRVLSQRVDKDFSANDNQQIQMVDDSSSEISANDELNQIKNTSNDKIGKIKSRIKPAATHRGNKKNTVKKTPYKLQKAQNPGLYAISHEEPPCKPKASPPSHNISGQQQQSHHFPASARQPHPTSESPRSNPYDANPSAGASGAASSGANNTPINPVNHQIIINNLQNIYVNMNCPIINYNNVYITQITMDGQQQSNRMGQQSSDQQQTSSRSDWQAQASRRSQPQNGRPNLEQIIKVQNNLPSQGSQLKQQAQQKQQQSQQQYHPVNVMLDPQNEPAEPKRQEVEDFPPNQTPLSQEGVVSSQNPHRQGIKRGIVGQNQHPAKKIVAYSPISSVLTQKNSVIVPANGGQQPQAEKEAVNQFSSYDNKDSHGQSSQNIQE